VDTDWTAKEAEDAMASKPYQQFFESLPLAAQVQWATAVGAEAARRFMGGDALPEDLAAALNSGVGAGATFVPTGPSMQGYLFRPEGDISQGTSMQYMPNWYCFSASLTNPVSMDVSDALAQCMSQSDCQGVAYNFGNNAPQFTKDKYADVESDCKQDLHTYDWYAKSTPALSGGWWPTGASTTAIPNWSCKNAQKVQTISSYSSLESAQQACASNPRCMGASYNPNTGDYTAYMVPYQDLLWHGGQCSADPSGNVWIVKSPSMQSDTGRAPEATPEDLDLWTSTQSLLLGLNGVVLDAETLDPKAANLCPYLPSQCSFSDCGVTCGNGDRTMMRQPRIFAQDCDIADMFSQTECEGVDGPCPDQCPIACNGQQCGGPTRGTCNTVSGQCECLTGYSGPDCWVACPVDGEGRVCGGRGTCTL